MQKMGLFICHFIWQCFYEKNKICHIKKIRILSNLFSNLSNKIDRIFKIVNYMTFFSFFDIIVYNFEKINGGSYGFKES